MSDINKIYGRLTIISVTEPIFYYCKSRQTFRSYKRVSAKCDCGVIKDYSLSKLKIGETKSCGCLAREQRAKRVYKHGLSDTKEYHIWIGIKQRCYNKNNERFNRYGERGIEMCKRWQKSFLYFLHDMGKMPPDCSSIERKNNNKGYCPSNCKWATPHEQSNNRSSNVLVTINNVTKNLTQWGKIYNISMNTISARIKNGWNSYDAITKQKFSKK